MLQHLEFEAVDSDKNLKLLCLVHTVDYNHQRAKHIQTHWGKDCDDTIYASNVSDPTLRGSIRMVHNGPEAYGNMWQKIRTMWEMAALTDYEWFHMSGDDTVLLVGNLRRYLSTLNPSNPYYLGRRFVLPSGLVFNSGASYVLNRAALDAWMRVRHECSPHKVTSAEDVEMGACLKRVGIDASDTRDENGRERFHPFNPDYMRTIRADDPKPWWFHRYTAPFELKSGMDGISPKSVSFHYVKNKRWFSCLRGFAPL